MKRTGFFYVALALITFALYAPVLRNDFVNFDDPAYVTENPNVQAGLTLRGSIWAFKTHSASNWHPLTWLSHQADCQFYGLNPAGHHLTNLLLHVANTLLLFAVLSQLTGATWRSASVAALFAWHPLHVESVAWIAERKDVLSTWFWLLTLWAYVRYAQEPEVESRRRGMWYGLALLMFALGLTSKPMLVTLPFVLLLLDYWPLGRMARHSAGGPSFTGGLNRLVMEKAPFFVLALGSCVVTIVAQRASGSVATLHSVPLSIRVSSAVVSYCRYLLRIFWPRHLSVFYPPVAGWPVETVLVSGLFLFIITWAVLGRSRSHPYLAVGWFWFLGTLVPVIGLVQVGTQAMADRYTYVPAIGIFIMVIWEVEDLTRKWPGRRFVIGLAGAAVLAGCLALTWTQVHYWRNSGTLFTEALREEPMNNFMAHTCLGMYLNEQGQSEEAIGHLREALAVAPKLYMAQYQLGRALAAEDKWADAVGPLSKAIEYAPEYAPPHEKLGLAQAKLGDIGDATNQFAIALRLNPRSAEAHTDFADLLAAQGKFGEANAQYAIALKLNPGWSEAHRGLGLLLAGAGKMDASVAELGEAIRLKPGDAEAYYFRGMVLSGQGKNYAAIEDYEAAVRLKPDWPTALNNLAWIRGTDPNPALRNGAEAVQMAERACELSGGNQTRYLGTLDAAYAEAGRFPEAITAAQKTHDAALAAGQKDLAAAAAERLISYRAGVAWRSKQ